MKVHPECAQCLLRRILYETELGGASMDQQYAAMKLAIDALQKDFSPDICSAEIATGVHRGVYDLLGKDPYADAKAKSNEIALQLLPKARRMVEESDDPFRTAVLCSIIGNVLDFGIRNDFQNADVLLERFDSLCEEGLGHDDTPEIKELARGSHIAYLTDNCGEIVFDRILVRELRKYAERITLLVRGSPILSDATREDVAYVGLDQEVDEVLDTGMFAVGIDLDRASPQLREVLYSADLIISKGMGNYEALSESDLRPIAYLLRTKCEPVARDIGVPKGTNVVKLVE